MAIRVLLDACVLFPEWLRDLLLRCAEAGLLQVAWTREILEEMRRNLESQRGLSPEKSGRLLEAMQRAFPDALVEGWEEHVATMTNHVKDRHVLAAAYEVARSNGATVVVTANLKDFPKHTWPESVSVLSPDELLTQLVQSDAATVVDLVWEHAQRRRKPPVSVNELLRGLGLQAPRFVQSLQPLIAIRTDQQLEMLAARLMKALGGPSTEFVVALADLSLADPVFHESMKARAQEHSSEIAEAMLAVLKDPKHDAMSRAWLRDRHISLSLEEVRRMSPGEFEALMDSSGHRKQ